jgi:hypothetical protein
MRWWIKWVALLSPPCSSLGQACRGGPGQRGKGEGGGEDDGASGDLWQLTAVFGSSTL